MPGENALPLITLGPFDGLDNTSIDVREAKDDGQIVSNVDQSRRLKGFVSASGRQNIYTYQTEPLLGTSTFNIYFPYNNTYAYVRQSTSGNVIVYDSSLGIEYSAIPAPYVESVYTQAVQFADTLFFNDGYQLRGTTVTGAFNPQRVPWQFAAPLGLSGTQGSSTTPVQTLQPNGLNNTYSYAITYVFAGYVDGVAPSSGYNGVVNQETTPYGNNYIVPNGYPVSFNVTTSGNFTTTLTPSGTMAFSGFVAGIPYTTNVYRYSLDQPYWALVASRVTGTTWTDTTTTSLSAAPQLIPFRDPPPNTLNNLGPIASWKERMWSFALQPTSTGQNTGWQCQLWYSNVGRPWEFDSVNQVLLVGSSAVAYRGAGSTIPYGAAQYSGNDDYPVGLLPMSSIMLLFKKRSTYYVAGDTAADFTVYPLFDIGLVSQRACVLARNIACWLSEEGVMSFDGSNLLLLSEKIRAGLDAISTSDKQNAVMFYNRRRLFLSFPASNITYVLYTPTQTWYTLPYSTNSAVSIPANTSLSGTIGELVTVYQDPVADVSTSSLVSWFAGENDLGKGITAVWASSLEDSEQPEKQKTYQWVTVEAPIQTGGYFVTATVQIDPGSPTAYSWTSNPIDLGTGETRHIVAIPAGSSGNKGYLASLTITATTPVGATQPVEIYSAAVYGQITRHLVIPS